MANNNPQRSQVVFKFILMEKFQKRITEYNFYNIMDIWFLPSWESESCEFYVELVKYTKA